MKKFKLYILYDDMSTYTGRFRSRKEAQMYAMMEGDHVWEYKIEEIKGRNAWCFEYNSSRNSLYVSGNTL